jgi:glycosyltransferase involved in cell wall biosynthesis
LFYPAYSGAALRFLRYLPGLKARGIQGYVFSGTPALDRAKASDLAVTWTGNRYGEILPLESINGIPVYRVRLPDAGSFQRTITYSHALAGFCQKSDYRPDLIQFFTPAWWTAPWLVRLRSLDIPTISTYTLLGELSSNPVKRVLQRHYWRIPFQLMNCVVVSSTVVREKLRNFGVTTRIEVIPNGVDINRFRPAVNSEERQEIRRRLGIGEEESIVLSVGPVTPRKGTDLLMSAWVQLAPRCPKSHLVIVGPRYDLTNPAYQDFRRKLETLIAASGAPNRVHLVGYVHNVEEYLRASDILVFTSLREGMGNVVLEAMASGLPVITTPFLGLPDEFGQPNEHYLLVERDATSLGAVIEQVLNDGARRDSIGLSARKRVEAQLDVDYSLDKYAALYGELAGRSEKRN